MDKRPPFAPVSQFSLDDYENLGKQQESLQNQKNAFYGPMPSAVDLQEQEHNAIREKYTKRQQIDMDRAEYEKNPSSANMSTARGLDAYISSTARKENPDFYKQDRKSNAKENPPQAQGTQEEVSTSSSSAGQGERVYNNTQRRNQGSPSGRSPSNSPENEVGNTVPKGGAGDETKNPKPKDTPVKPKNKDRGLSGTFGVSSKDKNPDTKSQVESVYNRLDVKGERRPPVQAPPKGQNKRDESGAAGYNAIKSLGEQPVIYDEKGYAKDRPAVEGGFWDWAEKNPGTAFLATGLLTAAGRQMYKKLNGKPAPHNLGPNANISKNFMNTPVTKVNPSNRNRPIPKGGSSNTPAQGALKIKRSPISNPSPAPKPIPKIKPPSPKPPAALPTSSVPKNKPKNQEPSKPQASIGGKGKESNILPSGSPKVVAKKNRQGERTFHYGTTAPSTSPKKSREQILKEAGLSPSQINNAPPPINSSNTPSSSPPPGRIRIPISSSSNPNSKTTPPPSKKTEAPQGGRLKKDGTPWGKTGPRGGKK